MTLNKKFTCLSRISKIVVKFDESMESCNTLDSGIDVAPGINIAPGTFCKNIKRSP